MTDKRVRSREWMLEASDVQLPGVRWLNRHIPIASRMCRSQPQQETPLDAPLM